MTPLSLVALASLCVAAPAPAPAGAGGTAADQAPAARAEALLREGVQRRLQGNEQEAYALFAAADELLPSPRAKAQMGLAAKSLKRYAEAERLLQTALAARDDPWIEAHRPTLAQALAFVARARAPAAEPPPAPGPPAPSLPAPAFASPAPAPSGARRLVLATAAVGAVGLTAGTVLGIRAWQLRGERDDVCPTLTCPSAAGVDLDRRGRRMARYANVSFAFGVAGALTATYLFLRGPAADAAEARPGVAVRPWGPLGLALDLPL